MCPPRDRSEEKPLVAEIQMHDGYADVTVNTDDGKTALYHVRTEEVVRRILAPATESSS